MKDNKKKYQDIQIVTICFGPSTIQTVIEYSEEYDPDYIED